MEKELSNRQIRTVFTEIAKRLLNPNFRFSQGDATNRMLDKFLGLFEKEFGNVTTERLVDFCICTAYAFRSTPTWTVKQIFGPAAIKRLKERKHGAEYYENQWLSEASLSRQQLIDMVADRSVHPQAKYLYMASEEATKHRMLNREVGFMLCQSSTLGWSPLSECCQQCNFVAKCQRETQRKYPELYRLRIENGRQK